MARGGWRRQPRDARGRFASYGYAGQTGGRGARLKSAGNTRDGGGAKMQAARPAGTIGKPAGLKPGSIKPKPVATSKPTRGQIRGNYRPENLFTKSDSKSNRGYGKDAKANIAEARRRVEATGAESGLKSNKRSSSVGGVSENQPNKVTFNASHSAWNDPKGDMIKSRRKNEFSTSSANHYAAHELGHVKNPTAQIPKSWETQLRQKGQIYADADKVVSAKQTARKVSKYAMTSPAEFTAEVAAGLSLGKKYPKSVMDQYRSITGRGKNRVVRGTPRLRNRK